MAQQYRRVVMKHSDMPEEMKYDAINWANQALDKFSREKDIATFIETEFDSKYQPNWECIAGRIFGPYLSYDTIHYFYFYIGHIAILLFKRNQI